VRLALNCATFESRRWLYLEALADPRLHGGSFTICGAAYSTSLCSDRDHVLQRSGCRDVPLTQQQQNLFDHPLARVSKEGGKVSFRRFEICHQIKFVGCSP